MYGNYHTVHSNSLSLLAASTCCPLILGEVDTESAADGVKSLGIEEPL